ncbi:MAG: DUF4399 domain-containing protein [Trueperaceae bacterium]|nr:MAG: DUF4399 domain-containing protein [Trueperaceae bacterium]
MTVMGRTMGPLRRLLHVQSQQEKEVVMRHIVIRGAAVLALLAATTTIALAQIERFEPAGDVTLQALFADFRHIPFDPVVVSEVITIHVR